MPQPAWYNFANFELRSDTAAVGAFILPAAAL